MVLAICNSGLSPKITIVVCCKHCACVTLYDKTARKKVQRPASYVGRRSIVTKERPYLIDIDSRETELRATAAADLAATAYVGRDQ